MLLFSSLMSVCVESRTSPPLFSWGVCWLACCCMDAPRAFPWGLIPAICSSSATASKAAGLALWLTSTRNCIQKSIYRRNWVLSVWTAVQSKQSELAIHRWCMCLTGRSNKFTCAGCPVCPHSRAVLYCTYTHSSGVNEMPKRSLIDWRSSNSLGWTWL